MTHREITVGSNGETVRLLEQSPTSLGQQLLLEHGGKQHRLALPLIGAYQAANVLTAAALVLATGGKWEETFAAMQRVAPVRGRLERAVISRYGVPVYIDYAHTPDALEAAIAALRPHVAGRLITVFGAGGDRDQGKRPQMGAVATRLSDIVIVTDDNPRGEEAARIRADIMAGAEGATEVPGRREAIAEAIRLARPGDIVLVDDTFAALQALGGASRERSRATIFGVTGSVGKTSTKEALYAALERNRPGKVHRSVKSYNNHTGVPLSLARMPREAEYAVLEMGMNNAGEISALTRQGRPNIAILTAIAPAHIENLGSEEAIADAKAEIFNGLEPHGIAILPNDTPHRDRLVRAARRYAERIITFGRGDADVHAVHAVGADSGGSLI